MGERSMCIEYKSTMARLEEKRHSPIISVNPHNKPERQESLLPFYMKVITQSRWLVKTILFKPWIQISVPPFSSLMAFGKLFNFL
jgi:hypothetical protein